MDLKKKYRLRVENCIGTIIDVHKTISPDYENQEFLSQFQSLQQAIDDLDMSLISEGDILMVEQATNALLGEFREIFKAAALGPVYEELKS
jgi:DNA-binding FrmR family transcriptional regulator